MPTRIKVCGITTADDARTAAQAGADAIGLVFYPASPRHLEPAQAQAILAALPPFVASVAVVLDPEPELIDQIAALAIDFVQYHGQEDPQLCARFPRRWIKTVPMADPKRLTDTQQRYPGAHAFLLDSNQAGNPGGQGQTFDWSAIKTADPRPIILAGGLQPNNVAQAIHTVHPWAVDVSSGVESQPGHKDPARLTEFIEEVRRADA